MNLAQPGESDSLSTSYINLVMLRLNSEFYFEPKRGLLRSQKPDEFRNLEEELSKASQIFIKWE